MMQLLATPIGLILAAAMAYLWFTMTPMPVFSSAPSIPILLITIAGIILLHEGIHAAVHPLAGRSQHTIVGFWPSRCLFYAAYIGELSRNHFVAILIMPLLIMTFLPLLIAIVTRSSSGWVAFVSIFNALLACGDVFATGMVLSQIPSSAMVRNQGWWTYWNIPTQRPS